VSGRIRAAAFDTRLNGPKVLTGSAAGSFSRSLRAAGFEVIADPQSYRVAAKATQEDALLDGELEAATAWGRTLGSRVPIGV
jgi:hypothetical protein